MVRVLSCHHFKGQRIGRCEEATGIAVARDHLIVGFDHQIHVYHGASSSSHIQNAGKKPSTEPSAATPGSPSLPTVTSKISSIFSKSSLLSHGPNASGSTFTDIGAPIHRYTVGPSKSQEEGKKRRASGASSVDSSESYDTELKLSHTFATIDLIDELSYNKKGKKN